MIRLSIASTNPSPSSPRSSASFTEDAAAATATATVTAATAPASAPPRPASASSSTSSTDRNREYLTALAVSNWGVALLTQRCYGQAVDMLHDALILINLACHHPCPFTVPYSEAPNDLQHILERATQRFAQPRPDEPLRGPGGQAHTPVAIFHPVSDDVDSNSMHDNMEVALRVSCMDNILSSSSSGAAGQAPSQNACNPDLIFPIRFEANNNNGGDASELRTEESAMLACAIVLHNLGLALLCQGHVVSQSSSHPVEADRLYRKAFKIFNMCQKITVALGQSLPHRLALAQQHPTHVRQLLCLQGIILVAYRHGMVHTGQWSEAQASNAFLDQVRRQIRELERWNWIANARHLAAAA